MWRPQNKISTGDVHKNVSSEREFRENQIRAVKTTLYIRALINFCPKYSGL